MCDLITPAYLTLLPVALTILSAEYAAYKLPLDTPDAWKIGACIGMLVSAIFTFFLLPVLLSSGLLCSGAAGF